MFTRFAPVRFSIVSLILALTLSACASQPSTPTPQIAPATALPAATAAPDRSDAAGMANPASVHCQEQGGNLVIRTAADGSQSGICEFDDGSECDEWAFFRGECGPSEAAATPADKVTSRQQPSAAQAPAVDAAKNALAAELGLKMDEISLKSVSEKDWPDACLGLAAPGEMCAQVIVPGYAVVLSAAGQDYTLRASQSGAIVLLEK